MFNGALFLCMAGTGLPTFVPVMPFPLLFDISGGELIVVLLFVLLFFGSKGIPDMARTLGRTMRQVRDAGQEVQREIHRGANDVRRTMEDQRRAFVKDLPKDPLTNEGGGPDDPIPPSDTGGGADEKTVPGGSCKRS